MPQDPRMLTDRNMYVFVVQTRWREKDVQRKGVKRNRPSWVFDTGGFNWIICGKAGVGRNTRGNKRKLIADFGGMRI